MIRDRLCMFLGGATSLFSSGVLAYAGSRLVYVVSMLDKPPEGLRNDLNLAEASAAGLGLGLALVLYALDESRRARATTRSGKLGIVLSGLLVILSAGLLLLAFQEVVDDLSELREMGHLKAGYAELPDEIARVISENFGNLVGGFSILLSAQLFLTLSLWPLFWSHAVVQGTTPISRRTLCVGLAGAVGFAALVFLATLSGGAALEEGAPQGNPAIEQMVGHIDWLLIWLRAAMLGLLTAGVSLTVLGLRFRVERHD
jgi:hypothetical protein